MLNGNLHLRDNVELGGGAQFWGYLSGMYQTQQIITGFRIELKHTSSDWKGTISYEDYRVGMLKTPELSGDFIVAVYASGTGFSEKRLELLDDPSIEHNPNISCRADNAGMIGIIAAEDGKDAKYWTVSNAYSRV